MPTNRGIVYLGPHKVEVRTIDYPELTMPDGRKALHGVIIKLIASNICGSDLHMYRGRTAAEPGTVFGHENTGEVIEVGPDVEYIEVGDIVSVPFNVACGRCRNCKERNTGVCENTNPEGYGGAYGYVGMGGWKGGQAEYMMVPYADFNLLRFPDRDQALAKMGDLTLLSDILPTGYHGAFTAGVRTGSTVYIAGAGPVGLCSAVSSQLLGAATVIVGDPNPARLALARGVGCETIDISKVDDLADAIEAILGVREVDCAVDCVGYEARGHHRETNEPAAVLNDLMEVARAPAGIGIPGLYLPEDPGAPDENTRKGILPLRIGLGWVKSQSFFTGQCPVMRYNRELMNAILAGRIEPSKALDITVISLDDAPEAYREFDQGAPKKFVIDPHGYLH